MAPLTHDAPIVSVCIPTYNRAALLPRAVESVLAQESPAEISDLAARTEIILCDDASTDDTPRVAAALARRDPRVRHERAPRNLGTTRNYSRAVALARGEFVALLSDDDAYRPAMNARRVSLLRGDPGLAFCVTAHCNVHDDGRRRDLFPLPAARTETTREFVLRAVTHSLTHTWNTVMMRRELAVAALPFDESLWPENDQDILLRIAIGSGLGAGYVHEVLLDRHHHSGNTYTTLQPGARRGEGAASAAFAQRWERRRLAHEYLRLRRRALEMLARREPEIEPRLGALLAEAGERQARARLRGGLQQMARGRFGAARETLREVPMLADAFATHAAGAMLLGLAAALDLG